MRPDLYALLAVLLGTGLCCVEVIHSGRFTAPMPGYFLDARRWAYTGHIADTFTPLAYPLFVGPALRWGGMRGILVAQLALQLALTIVAYLILRTLRLRPLASALGILPVALHPDLIASVIKVWDLTLSTFFLLLMVLCCLRLLVRRSSTSFGLALTTGAVFGLGISCRPNYILLLPAIALALHRQASWVTPPGRQRARAALLLAASAVVGSLCFAAVGVLAHGSVFLPRNGPYNLYAGHNPRTIRAMVVEYNAEFSLRASFAAERPANADPDIYAPSNDRWYLEQSLRFARVHPGTELLLVLLKLAMLFRPDTKVHRLLSPLGLVRVVLALPFALLLGALLLPPRPRLLAADRLLLFVEVAYVLPFLITNSGPHFRTSLDMLLLLHAASLVCRRLWPGELEPVNASDLYLN